MDKHALKGQKDNYKIDFCAFRAYVRDKTNNEI